jgi:tetratricopeptide (TPR) repeat protein
MRQIRRNLLLVLMAAFAGCATARYPEVYPSVDKAIAQGQSQGLELENPFLIDDEIAKAADMEIGRWGSPYDRLHRILSFMNSRGLMGFQYAQDVTVTAKEAYHARRGNCMSYTNLFLGIARHLDVPVFLIHINEATSFYEKQGTFVVSSHMAIGYDTGLRITLVDLGGESDRLRVYERASDLVGLCLFYNNVAVEKMLSGDIAGAEKLLIYLTHLFPPLKETQNNLGVLKIREGRYDEALSIYSALAKSSPDYRPAFTNGLVAARGAGKKEVAEMFSRGATSLAEKDPFYLFNQGVASYQGGLFDVAESFFHRAAFQQPNNPLLRAWLAKTYLQTGRTQEGLQEFKKAQDLAPYHRILLELRTLYPALAEIPPPPPAPASPAPGSGEPEPSHP